MRIDKKKLDTELEKIKRQLNISQSVSVVVVEGDVEAERKAMEERIRMENERIIKEIEE
jgi:hypothetical protein